MAKDDLGEAPLEVPKKRRVLEQMPDLWLAQWLARDTLTPSERRRIAEQRQTRKDRKGKEEVKLGIVAAAEGATPEQKNMLREMIEGYAPTEIHRYQLPRYIHSRMLVHMGAPILAEESNNDVVRHSTVVIAVAKETVEPLHKDDNPVWSAVKYARHRKIPVKVILPDGKVST